MIDDWDRRSSTLGKLRARAALSEGDRMAAFGSNEQPLWVYSVEKLLS